MRKHELLLLSCWSLSCAHGFSPDSTELHTAVLPIQASDQKTLTRLSKGQLVFKILCNCCYVAKSVKTFHDGNVAIFPVAVRKQVKVGLIFTRDLYFCVFQYLLSWLPLEIALGCREQELICLSLVSLFCESSLCQWPKQQMSFNIYSLPSFVT